MILIIMVPYSKHMDAVIFCSWATLPVGHALFQCGEAKEKGKGKLRPALGMTSIKYLQPTFKSISPGQIKK